MIHRVSKSCLRCAIVDMHYNVFSLPYDMVCRLVSIVQRDVRIEGHAPRKNIEVIGRPSLHTSSPSDPLYTFQRCPCSWQHKWWEQWEGSTVLVQSRWWTTTLHRTPYHLIFLLQFIRQMMCLVYILSVHRTVITGSNGVFHGSYSPT